MKLDSKRERERERLKLTKKAKTRLGLQCSNMKKVPSRDRGPLEQCKSKSIQEEKIKQIKKEAFMLNNPHCASETPCSVNQLLACMRGTEKDPKSLGQD